METLTTAKRSRKEEKSRTFSVQLLGFMAHDALWDPPKSKGDTIHPCWIAYLGSEQELQPFTANFRASRPAVTSSRKLQLPKRAKYRWNTHKLPGANVTVAYLPQLFHLENDGRVEDVCQFIFAPPTWWVERQAEMLRPELGTDARDAARAALFTTYLDRRVTLPILADLRLQLQIYRAAVAADWTHSLSGVSYGTGFKGFRDTRWGLDEPLSVRVYRAQLEDFLVQQTQIFHEQEMRHGQTRSAADCRLLPHPSGASEQLRLDFGLEPGATA